MMSTANSQNPPALSVDAAGLMSLARGSGSYSCKTSSLIDVVDNFTSPQAEATEVEIRLTSTKTARGDEKAKVHEGQLSLSCVYGEAQKLAVPNPLTKHLCDVTTSRENLACSDGLLQEGHR